MKKEIVVGIVLMLMAVGLLSGCIGEDDTTIYDVWVSVINRVTPNDPLVINITRVILGEDADGDLTPADVTKIQEWIHNNIKYTERYDKTFFPNETLLFRNGDCSEMCVLEYSILAYENKNNAGIYVVNIKVKAGNKRDHGCILVVFDDVLFLSDPTYQDVDIGDMFKPTTNIREIIDDIFLNSYYQGHAVEKYDIYAIFSECCFCTFENNKEFYGWCDYQLNPTIR